MRSDEQRQLVEKVIKKVDQLKRYKNPVVTKIEQEKVFYKAEDYHQKYLQKNPGGYTCHYIRD